MSFLLCIYSICCNKLIIKLYYPHSKCGVAGNCTGGSNPSLSAERAGQKWSANGQKATNQ